MNSIRVSILGSDGYVCQIPRIQGGYGSARSCFIRRISL